MSTLKYKATERYSFGWTDPRGVMQMPRSLLREPGTIPTQLQGVLTSVLRNLWLAKWGQRAADAQEVYAAYAAGDGILDVMHELNNRNLITYQTVDNVDTMTLQNYYVLKKEDHADC